MKYVEIEFDIDITQNSLIVLSNDVVYGSEIIGNIRILHIVDAMEVMKKILSIDNYCELCDVCEELTYTHNQ